jgi:hypothetical protein
MLWISLLTAKAINNSKNIDAVALTVLAFSIPVMCSSLQNNNKVIVAPIKVLGMINFHDQLSICSCLDLGFLFMIHFSQGSALNANVGRLSVTKFIRSICIGIMGNGTPTTIHTPITSISSKFTDSRYFTAFLILS